MLAMATICDGVSGPAYGKLGVWRGRPSLRSLDMFEYHERGIMRIGRASSFIAY